jgi:integrase
VAYFRKAKGGWRVEVERQGVRKSLTFPTKAEAQAWALREEAALLAVKRGQYPRRTLRDAMDRYLKDVSSHKAASAVGREGRRFEALSADFPALAGTVLSGITTADVAAWRDARLRTVTRGTVQRDINLLSNLFQVAAREWKWCAGSPFSDLRAPGNNPPRRRLIGWREARAMLRALHYTRGEPALKLQEVAAAFMVALRTGLRAGELLALTPAMMDLERGVLRVPHKMQYRTGRPREVPLAPHAVRLLRPLAGRDPVFQVSAGSLDALFRKTREQCGLKGFTFHDTRATALTHLARKVDVLTLQRISGHKDIRTLSNVYYRESAESIASRLR